MLFRISAVVLTVHWKVPLTEKPASLTQSFILAYNPYISVTEWEKTFKLVEIFKQSPTESSSGFSRRSGLLPAIYHHRSRFFPSFFIIFHWKCIFVWIQQRVQLSWTRTGTLGRRQTASLSWPFTLTQTAVGAGVEVWEMVTPTARGALGVRRTRTPTDSLSRRWYNHCHAACQVPVVHMADGWF